MKYLPRWLVLWLLGLPQDLAHIQTIVAPFITEAQRQKKACGWNGDTRRRHVVYRVLRHYPQYQAKDVILALELEVRRLL